MKKLFTLFLAILVGAGTMFASETEVDGIWYNLYEDEGIFEAEVTYRGSSYKSYSDEYTGDVVIPTSIVYNNNTYSVTSIGDYAFSGCLGLTSVTIPNSVTRIKNSAFFNCYGLTSVHISDLAAWCKIEFWDHSSNPLDYAHKLYLKGELVTDLVIPNSVTSIGDYAFCECTGLTSVTISNSVISIGYNAFYNCSALTSIEIPNSVTSIGYRAFRGCTGLTSVDIPESVVNIGENAFWGVHNVNYTGKAVGAPWGALMLNREQPILSVSEIRSIAFELGLLDHTLVDYYLFTGVISSIEEVNTTYGNATFKITDGQSTFSCYCIHDYYGTQFTSSDQLHVGDSVVISSQVQLVQNNGGYTSGATYGRLEYHSANPLFSPDGILYFGQRLGKPDELKLYYAENTDTLDIPASVTYDGQIYSVTEMATDAFYDREDLTCVILPTTLKYMPYAFGKCNSIHSLYYNPINLTKPTKVSFSGGNTSLHNIYIGKDVLRVPESFFDSLTNLSYVEWNALSCEDMEYSPFYYSRNRIQSFVIVDSIKRIPANICWGIKAVDTLSIPSSVYYIGKDAFYNTNISEVNIHSNVRTVGGRAFAYCPLTKVHWDVADQDDYEIYEDNNCITVSLDVSTVDWNNVYLYAWDANGNSICGAWPGRALTKDENGRYTYAFSSTYTTVNIIWNNGTDQTLDITDVTASTIYTPSSSSGKSIWCSTRPLDGRLASPFYRSTDNITQFTFGQNVTRVPAQLCRNMKNITNVDLPLNTTEIGKAAFKGCSKLESIVLNENITSYGAEVLAGCPALTTIYNYRKTPAKLGENAFDGIDYFNCTLYVLGSSIDMYKASGSDWKDFYTILPIGAKTVTVDEIEIQPHVNTADMKWLKDDDAVSYELVIKDKNGDVVCTLIFDVNGLLTAIDFSATAAAPSRHNAPKQTTANGFSFTITGLERASKYAYTLTTKDANNQVINTYSGTFVTEGYDESTDEGGGSDDPSDPSDPSDPDDPSDPSDPSDPGDQAIDNVQSDKVQCTKLLRNGQILILRGDRTYTLTGQEVK